jgi:deoxyribodipyrimidine photo-lyase
LQTAIVLFTRDLRVRDQPALATAAHRAERLVPLFVFDDPLLEAFGAPNRVAFLRQALDDLDRSFQALGARLLLRRGDVVHETMRVAEESRCEAVFMSEDVSRYARTRAARLERACRRARIELVLCPGVAIVAPGDLAPDGGEAFRVFTPYWRRWRTAVERQVVPSPKRLRTPAGLRRGRFPGLAALAGGNPSPQLPAGGEHAAWRRANAWIQTSLRGYAEAHDDLAADHTSRLSPYLHFGCISPLELFRRVDGRPGGEAFARQLCWRDFHHQLAAAGLQGLDTELRPAKRRWRSDEAGLDAWTNGRTGIPIVDAGMRQLRIEGWMHNRARLIAGSFLTKDLAIDWRRGASHFFDLLVDGDVANNVGNWQWVAGTGADTRPNRVLNPLRQAKRFDPDGTYVRRYVPELAEVEGAAVHVPWTLGRSRPGEYPLPIVDHADAVERLRAERREPSGKCPPRRLVEGSELERDQCADPLLTRDRGVAQPFYERSGD